MMIKIINLAIALNIRRQPFVQLWWLINYTSRTTVSSNIIALQWFYPSRLNSFNKRSNSESEDPWRWVVPIESEQQHVQQTTIASTTNATATITSNTTLLTNMITTTTITTTTSFVRQLASCDWSSSSEQHRYPMCVSNFEPQRHSHQQINKIFHDSSRQISDDISWEFAISEAPIARLESLDELDQDHGK
ncbi:hypothetical protein TSAR_011267 [Trichomalopsis sarcophagae]|uniref:Uncharacterized protein n=1 Tax=Trichomalopsis sarcophagae TaxID=543379 RepID=A0A232FAF0_9HYME|nr:hypothetical protein TSAR_011267 [Trichomalopsis sarcophagae]